MFLLSPEADMRPGDLQAQVPWRTSFLVCWQEAETASDCPTKGSLANQGRSVLRLWPTGRTRIIAESQGNRVSHSPTVSRLSCRSRCAIRFQNTEPQRN